MSRCAVIVPVLNRPQNAEPLVHSLMASTDRAELVFVCSYDDEEQMRECVRLVNANTHVTTLVRTQPSGPGDYAAKIQHGYDWPSKCPLVLLAADDLIFHPGWLEAVEAIADQYDCGVIGTNDMANPLVKRGLHSTHPVVRRCYIDQYGGVVGEPGKVYSEAYSHQWVDVELCQTAMARGCYQHAHDAVIEHRHPLFNRAVKSDATYKRGQADGLADRNLYESRRHLWEQEATRQAGRTVS